MGTSKEEFLSGSQGETESIGEGLSKRVSAGSRIGLIGELGAGKTSFVRGIAKGLGTAGSVKSPSFAILNVYSSGRVPLYHIDLYRLSTIEEFHDAGLMEYVYGDGVCVIEWAERVGEVLKDCDAVVRFSVISETERAIEILYKGPLKEA
jgi:tRNA threonylcarbamoyladenosine biosynthesis protein TsaE